MAIRFGDLKEAYAAAKRRGENTFEIDGVTMVSDYAKYLIEFLALKGISDENILNLEPAEWDEQKPKSNING